MEENNKAQTAQEQQYEEIDLMELLRKLIANWKLILKWCAVAAVLSIIIGYSIPKSYTVKSCLAPEVASRSSSSLSSLASIAGINLGSASSQDAVYPDLYPQIVSSSPFVVELFSAPVSFETKRDGIVETDLYTYMKEYTRKPWWNAVISAPFKALGWFMGLFREKVEPVEGYENINPAALTHEQEAISHAISECIQLSIDKSTSLINLSITTQDPNVSTQLSEEVIANLVDFVTGYRTEKSRKDLEYYELLFEEAKAEYYAAQQEYASYVDANQNVILESVRTEQTRLSNEMNLAYNLYNSCAQQVQMAKAEVQQETPVCVVIQPPTLPTKASAPSKMLIMVGFVFLAACLAAVWVLFGRDWMAGFKASEQSELSEA